MLTAVHMLHAGDMPSGVSMLQAGDMMAGVARSAAAAAADVALRVQVEDSAEAEEYRHRLQDHIWQALWPEWRAA